MNCLEPPTRQTRRCGTGMPGVLNSLAKEGLPLNETTIANYLQGESRRGFLYMFSASNRIIDLFSIFKDMYAKFACV